jgi:uncharacterized membrane protein YebE (DUF533 family)
MAHVHGAKAVADAATKTMDSAMAGMGKMGESMMQPMTHTMTHSMSQPMAHSMMKNAGKGAVAGVAATAGKSTLTKVLTHPVTLIGFGFVLGYLAYKYRKDIISASDEE